MRAVTLSSPAVIAKLDERFVVTWHNQAPDVFPAGAAEIEPLPEEYRRNFPDGAGGANVKLFFCTPGGKVVHFVQGYYRPETFLAEVTLALELLEVAKGPDAAARLTKVHEERQARFTAEAARETDRLVSGLLLVRAENHRLARERLLADPAPHMVNEDLGFS
jgi:hypothetical protein